MQVPVDVGMSPAEYARRFGEVEWPVFDVCPICGTHARLQSHGSYSRNSLPDRETELATPIHPEKPK